MATDGMIQEGLATEHDNIESEDELIHEHQFISTTLKGASRFGIYCITCGACYCQICGKSLVFKKESYVNNSRFPFDICAQMIFR